MLAVEIVNVLQERFGPLVLASHLDAIDPWVFVDPTALVEFCSFLRGDERLHFDILNCISGVDYLETDPKKVLRAGYEPHLEVVYHISSFQKHHRCVFKVLLPRWLDDKPGRLPVVPSVTSIWPAANWHEREVYDLAGIWFEGHPDLTRILLAEDWEGHPLRKDYEYPLEYHGIRAR